MTMPARAAVLVDATAGARPERSGVGRYVHNLLAALAERPDLPRLALGVRSGKWRHRGHLPTGLFTPPLPVRRLLDWIDRFGMRSIDLVHGLDVRLPPNRRVTRIATLHDLFSLERDDLAPPSFREKRIAQYCALADSADRVICVSAATEAGFLRHFPAARGRTCVVHHGVEPRFRRADAAAIAELRARRHLPPRYLLFVGLLSTRKNLLYLLEAFRVLAERHPDLHLVLAGRPSFGFERIEEALARHPQRARIVLPGFVADDDLPALYSGAECFVFPSVLEGFGLPVLEAFACGTPVVASALPVLEEIGGGELTLVAGDAPEQFAAALEQQLAQPCDPLRRARLVAQAARFTWSAAAQATVAAWDVAHRARTGRALCG